MYSRDFAFHHSGGLIQALDSLHEALSDAEKWPQFLAAAARAVGASSAALISLSSVKRTNLWIPYRLDHQVAERWQSYFRRIDPWFNAQTLPERGQYHVFSGESLVSDDILKQTEYYRDFLLPNNLRWLRGAWAKPDAAFGSTYGLLFWRGPDQTTFDPVSDKIIDSLIQSITRLEKISVANALGRASGLDSSDSAAYLLNDRGALLMCNQRAADYIENGAVVEGGRSIAFSSHGATSWLQALVAQAASMADVFATPAHYREKIPGLGMVNFNLHPIKPIGSVPSLMGVRYALMMRQSYMRPAANVARSAARLYGWTAAELDTVTRLAAGDELSTIANARGCSVETVRSHLKNSKRKAGVKRQVELVRTMFQLQGWNPSDSQ